MISKGQGKSSLEIVYPERYDITGLIDCQLIVSWINLSLCNKKIHMEECSSPIQLHLGPGFGCMFLQMPTKQKHHSGVSCGPWGSEKPMCGLRESD